MANSTPSSSVQTPTSSSTSPRRALLTRAQVLAGLREEVSLHGLSNTARKYDLTPQQVWNVTQGGRRMTKAVYAKLNYVMYELFERKGDKSDEL